jgi:hypothetical protein
MMLVVNVQILVLQRFVRLPVFMALRYMEPHPGEHEHAPKVNVPRFGTERPDCQ